MAQAVGTADVGSPNPSSSTCHRAVDADGGSPRGYAGGLERKRYLLDLRAPALNKSARLF
ncbi:MGMT family protein [Streptomyces sp. MC1]|nr:MGMT family protein [Streptomyces sp. MC1]